MYRLVLDYMKITVDEIIWRNLRPDFCNKTAQSRIRRHPLAGDVVCCLFIII